jgi:putative ABC transport system permease protein
MTVARLLFHPLAWLLDAPLADAILGDLEELRRRRAARSTVGAWTWFFRAALGILLHAFGVRLRAAVAGAFSSGGAPGVGGDLQRAVRTLRRRPGFSLAVVLLLALGIGANTAVFSIVQAVLLRPLPYADPGRLVFIWGGTDLSDGRQHRTLTGRHVNATGRQQTTLESFAAFKAREIGLDGAIDLLRAGGSERLRGAHVTANFFELLGVQAASGRVFSSQDKEAQPAVVISHGLWQRGFGGSASVIGEQIAIASGREVRDRRSYTVVGVLPDTFRFTYPGETEIYLLMPWERIRPERALEYALVARLKRDVTAPQASAELTEIARNVTRTYATPGPSLDAMLKRSGMIAEPMREHMVAEVTPGLTVVAWVAGLVLLIACVNVGLLMVSRTIDRGAELAVRAALGAGPGRIVRLMLFEGCALALIGGAAGVALAYLVMPGIRSFMPPVVPRVDQIRVDPQVLLFALAATLVSSVVCGLLPAVVTLRGDLLAAVRRTGPTTTVDRKLTALRGAVVGVQVALVLVLLVGAGLLLHSFWRMTVTPLGFAGEDVLTFEVRLLNPKYREHAARREFAERVLSEIERLPGVAAAAASTAVPMRGVDFIRGLQLPEGRLHGAHGRSVDVPFFSILQIPLVAGRVFTDADARSGRPVTVVSQRLAEILFGREPAIGREVILEGKRAEIIGVVADVRYADIRKAPAAAFYTLRPQYPSELQCFLVQPRPGATASVSRALADIVGRVDADQPLEGLTTVGAIVARSASDRRFYALVTGAFAAVALLLAIVGLFGVVARAVTERRRELAIRTALGADRVRILRLVLTHGLLPVVFGCLAGLVLAVAASRLVQSLVFEISATDPLTYAAAVGLILLLALLACVFPGIRAVRLDTMAVLRSD